MVTGITNDENNSQEQPVGFLIKEADTGTTGWGVGSLD